MNSFINMGGGSYATDLQRLQRQQRLADMLQQDALTPLEAPQGAVAPISFTNVLAKMLAGYNANKANERIDKSYADLNAKDRNSAQALIQALNQRKGPMIEERPTTIDGTPPMLPGQTAPQPVGPQATVQVGGQAPLMPSNDEKIAMLLGADGGPQVQAISNAMLPQIMQRQNQDYQQQLQRDQSQWEHNQPLGLAARQNVELQNKGALDLAAAKNKLPMTEYERAQVAADQRKTNLMYGSGIDANDPRVGYWVDAVRSGAVPSLAQVPKQYRDGAAKILAETPQGAYGPLAARRFTMASSAITKPYRDMAAYTLTRDAAPYLQRIDAAIKEPGSVSDVDLIDSLIKLNTGGNAVTEAQVHLITQGKSWGDAVNVWKNKLKTGGVISNEQRQQVVRIAHEIYENYKKGWAPIQDEVFKKLEASNIPKPFWDMPDLNRLEALGKKPTAAGGGGRTVKRTGTANGRKVIEYSDGTVEYAN